MTIPFNKKLVIKMLIKITAVKLSKLFIACLFLIGAVGCGGGETGIDAKLDLNNAPQIELTSPSHGDTQSEIENISFTATASDSEDGDISANIQWQSSIDGDLGSGSDISVHLNPGKIGRASCRERVFRAV